VNVEQAAQRTSGYAVASLVLGIAGLFIFPLIPSILAVIFGSKARDEIRATPAIGGDGLATAGLVLGWVGIALTVLGLFVILLVLLAVAGG
jgi:mannose/fructose/N-acetylgalactosamine-specific phosphotransferase system component IIC